jgi:hypothetical protein
MVHATRRTLLAAVGLALLLPAAAAGSQESQRLVAEADGAYAAARYDDARRLYEEAVAADGADEAAHYGLGRALARLGRWDEAVAAFDRALALRPDFAEARRERITARAFAVEAAYGDVETRVPAAPELGRPRNWSVGLLTGFQYDDNVTLTPDGRPTGPDDTDQEDGKYIISGQGRYDFLDTDNTLLRAEYDLYQTLHFDVTDFDFRSHRIRGTASRRLRPRLWAGVQGGYNHYSLGDSSYLGEPFVDPFVSWLQGERGVTQLQYRHGDTTYFGEPFNNVRDGPVDTVGATQTVYFAKGRYYVSGGYQFGSEDPTRSGDTGFPLGLFPGDYAFDSHQGHVGLGAVAWWQTIVDFMYVYRHDDYTEPNSLAGFRKTRHDNVQQIYVAVSRMLAKHARAGIEYYGTFNDSNIPEFEYSRNQVSILVELLY